MQRYVLSERAGPLIFPSTYRAAIQAEDVAPVGLQASVYDDRETVGAVEALIASAIHNNHSAPPGLAPPCFLCRRDAKAVLDRLQAMGMRVTPTVL